VAVPELPVLALLPAVVVVLALLPVDPVLLALLLPWLQVVAAREPHLLLAQAPLEAAVAQEAVELHRSFSAAMAGIFPSPGPPMYAPAPRSRRNPQLRPCPLA
jgi:hypothetical protein